MASRLELQAELEELLGSNQVFYQPPESLKMSYPAIVYSLNDIEATNANNKTYLTHRKYDITVISKLPDNPVIQKLIEMQHCTYDRQYKADNLNHDVLTLYY